MRAQWRFGVAVLLTCLGLTIAACGGDEEGESEPGVFRITTASLPEIYLNVACTLPLDSADGGGGPYTWGVVTGSLPPGLTLDGSTTQSSAILGTPTATGNYSFTIRVQDAVGGEATKAFAVVVSNRLVIVTPTLPSLIVNVAGSRPLTAANGSGVGYSWSVSGGTLPPGLALGGSGTPSTTLDGTPTALGTYNFTIQVTDSLSNTDSRGYTMRIVPPLVITTASLPPAMVSEPYSTPISATGGTGIGYQWQISPGPPDGLTIDAGTPAATLRGIPRTQGVTALSLQVTDSDGHNATAARNIEVDAELRITTGWVPQGTTGAAYSYTLQRQGGRAAYTWTVVDGATPAGVSLSTAGVLSGTPSSAGISVFRVRLQDGAGRQRTRVFTIDNVATGTALSLRTQLPPIGVTGRPYFFELNGIGGSGAGYSWSVVSGSLPPGLSLSASGTPCASLSGTPTTAGSYAFTVELADSAAATTTRAYDLTVGAPGTILAYAGGGTGSSGGIGNGGQAVQAVLNQPHGLDRDASGNIYIADTNHNRIRRIDATTGVITTVAGTGVDSFSGDGGQATAAEMWLPHDVAVDRTNNLLYIADYGNERIRRVDLSTGIITTFAGGGTSGLNEGGQATDAELPMPEGLGLDAAGNVYVACRSNQYGNMVRRVLRATGVINSIAGNGTEGYSGDNGDALSAQLGQPRDVAVDAAGDVYIADSLNNRIRKVTTSTGMITTFAGTGTQGATGDGGQAIAATLSNVAALTFDAAGNLYVADYHNNRVRRIAAGTNIITTIAGSGTPGASGGGPQGDGGPATSATLDRAAGVCLDTAGNVLVADMNNDRVRMVNSGTQNISTVAGGGVSVSGPGPPTDALMIEPRQAVVDGAGNVFIADLYAHFVYRISAATGLIEVFAGLGVAGGGGDGGPATSANLDGPGAVAVDRAGNVYIAETFGHRVRRVDAFTGVITRVAGTGTGAYSGDGGPGTSAQLHHPISIAFHPSGAILILDLDNHRVRRLDLTSGVITRIAGTGTNTGPTPGSPAISEPLPICFGLAVSVDGDVAVSSASQDCWVISNLTGLIDVVSSGSPLGSLSGVAFTPDKDVLLGDEGVFHVWRVPAGSGTPAAIAGSGTPGNSGDGGAATSAQIAATCIPGCTPAGDVLVASGDRVRLVLEP